MSLAAVVERLWSNGQQVPAAAFTILGFVLPAVDFVLAVGDAILGQAVSDSLECLQDRGLLCRHRKFVGR